jgi:BASS family bile acid:Na+ symporter
MEDSIFAAVLLPLALAVIMASLGMSLTPEDFKRVFAKPRGVSIGLLNLVLLSPLLAFAVAHAFSLEPALAVGLVLLGASPGGILANLLTHFARGDTALSITMTAFSSLAAVLTVPLFLGLATAHFGATRLDEHVSMPGVVARVLLITVVPLAIGLWLRARYPERVAEIGGTVRRVTAVVFISAVAGVIVAEHGRVLDNLGLWPSRRSRSTSSRCPRRSRSRAWSGLTAGSRLRSRSSSASTMPCLRSPSGRRSRPY